MAAAATFKNCLHSDDVSTLVADAAAAAAAADNFFPFFVLCISLFCALLSLKKLAQRDGHKESISAIATATAADAHRRASLVH